MEEREPLMVEPEEVENRGVEVIEQVDILHGSAPQFVGRSMADTSLHSSARQPASEAVRIVVSPASTLLEERHAPELGAPDDECFLEQAARFQVFDQGRHRLVEDFTMDVILFFQFVMTIPVELAAAGVGTIEELHEADAPLDEAPSQDAVACECGLRGIRCLVRSILPQDIGGLPLQIADDRDFELHAGGQFITGDPSRQVAVARMPRQMPSIHAFQ